MGRGNYIPSTPFTYYFYVIPDIEYEDDYDYTEEWYNARDDLREILYDLIGKEDSQWIEDSNFDIVDEDCRWGVEIIEDDSYFVVTIVPDIDTISDLQPGNIYERSAYWSETLAELS